MTQADDIQAVSVDEALVEATSGVARYKEEHPESTRPEVDFADLLRERVRSETGCEGAAFLACSFTSFTSCVDVQ
jgi:DNA repair protein REV1